ncbi:MAG: ankyrin repeat domain-containing protein [Candidatus Aenigmatarchaeota archaeon]
MGVNIQKISDYLAKTNCDYKNDVFEAVKEKDNSLVNFFLTMGFNIECTNDFGETLLMAAIKHNNYELVEFLIKKNANVNAIENNYGSSVFQYACMFGTLELVKKIIQKNVNIHYRDKKRMHAIHYATINGNIELLRFLINDVYKNKEIILLKDFNGKNCLNYAIDYRHYNLVYFFAMLNKRALFVIDNFERTLLINAVLKNAPIELIEFLVKNGVQVKKRDIFGKNIFDYVNSHRKYEEIIKSNLNQKGHNNEKLRIFYHRVKIVNRENAKLYAKNYAAIRTFKQPLA